MRIDLNFDPATVNSANLGANLGAFEAQTTAAAHLFETTYLDPVTVNITVEYGNTGLGQSNQQLYSYSLGTVKDALQKDITSLDDLQTVNVLGTSGTVYLTHAQLKALGLIAGNASGSDGTITFSNTSGILDFSHSSSMSGSSYDLFGVAAHEISEIMGRIVNPSTSLGPLPTILTQFDVGGSLKIGSDTLLPFNTVANADLGDWASSVPANDAFRAFASPGIVSAVSQADLRAMDVIGWDHKALDLVFAIDTTGSMGPYIDNVKANAVSIVNAAFGAAADLIDTRIGIVGFKDAVGPDGPGENTDLLNFTEQSTYAARKTAAINAINSITVGGGGDIPEGDNSALLYALQGNLGSWRRSAQDHKIILFTDAPIKDTGLASQVASAAAALGVTVTSSSVASMEGGAFGNFSFTAPLSAALSVDGSDSSGSDGSDEGDVDGVTTGPAPATITFSSQVYAIQVGSDSSATDGLMGLANSTGGKYFSGGSSDLSDLILSILSAPPININGTVANQATNDGATINPFGGVQIIDSTADATGTLTVIPSSAANGTFSNLGGGTIDPFTGAYTVSGTPTAITAAVEGLAFNPAQHQVAPGDTVTTNFNVSFADISGASAIDTTTSVVVTAADVPGFAAFDVTTGHALPSAVQSYSGPVANLENQYINTTPDNINVTATSANWFLHSGSGTDGLTVTSGTNVLDGGTGSNFLVGSLDESAFDTFFVDDRSPPSDIWSTVVNFHAGDAATIFGITPSNTTAQWVDGQGAAGYTGLTLHEFSPGNPTASITLTGFSNADLSSGRLSTSFGTEADGTPYLYISAKS